MNRFLLSALIAFAGYFGVRALVRVLASDETKIRWVVEDMAEGFNDTRMSPILDGLARDFLDETWGADRDLVHAGLARMFFESKDAETKRFLYRVEMPKDELTIAIDGDKAELSLVATFFEVHGEQEKLAWKARMSANLVKTDDGWKLHRSQGASLEGKRLH